MITLTPEAVSKVKEFLDGKSNGQNLVTGQPVIYTGLRVGVRGGGCSGFSYQMVLITTEDVDPSWQVIEQDGIKVYVDNMSAMYLEGVVIDFVSLMSDGQSGFKFTNPNVKSTCGCGSSFSA
jgi:iron-sulfur cluster insertion protein